MKLTPVVRRKIISSLRKLYPEPESELRFDSPFQLVVAVLLSAQCTDKKVNEVTPILFKRYPNFTSLANAKVGDIEKIIRPINYYRTKSRNLVGLGDKVVKEFGGILPETHEELISLPGVGNKTANVVLGERSLARTFPVDTHVFRVSRRLGLTKATTPIGVENDLKKLFRSNLWRNFHHWLILHGRRVCKAQRPLCESCPLNSICPSSRVQTDR